MAAMPVLSRPFFNLAVIKAPLHSLIAAFAGLPPLVRSSAMATPLTFPAQPYNAGPQDPPLLLWSPACAPEITAFMPRVSSGDYFVTEYACRRFGFAGAAVRSSTQKDESPVNEFITYEANQQRRVVRAMKDSPRWDFYTEGEPLDFEDTSAYTARYVRDRFQREALLDYLALWGAPVSDAGFWTSKQQAMTLLRPEPGKPTVGT
jgi:hypothetical protein